MKKLGVFILICLVILFVPVFAIEDGTMGEEEQEAFVPGGDVYDPENYQGTSLLEMGAKIVCKSPSNYYRTGISVESEAVDEPIPELTADESPEFLTNWGNSDETPLTFLYPTDILDNYNFNEQLNKPGFGDIKAFIFEGLCRLYVKAHHVGKYLDGETEEYIAYDGGSQDGGFLIEEISSYLSGNPFPGSTTEPTLPGSTYNFYQTRDIADWYEYDYAWDNTSSVDNCIGATYPVGGEIGNSDYIESKGPSTNFGEKDECCGDDYLWIMNGAYNYQSNDLHTIDEACLYSYSDVEVEMSPIHPGKIYSCSPAHNAFEGRHKTEDNFLMQYGSGGNEEDWVLFSLNALNDPLTVTDVGVRFYLEGTNDKKPLYCHHYFGTSGDQFQWMYGQVAGEIHYFNVGGNDGYTQGNVPQITTGGEFELNQKAPDYIYEYMTESSYSLPIEYQDSDDYTICNLFLGGAWTGHHCCGSKYDYTNKVKIEETFNDIGDPSNSNTKPGYHYVLGEDNIQDYIMDTTEEDGEVWLEPNKACYKANAVESGAVFNDDTGDNIPGFNIDNPGQNGVCSAGDINDGDLGPLGKFNTLNPADFGYGMDHDGCCNAQFGEEFEFIDGIIECSSETYSNSLLNKEGTLNLCMGDRAFIDANPDDSEVYNWADVNANPYTADPNLFSSASDDTVYTSCESVYFTPEQNNYDYALGKQKEDPYEGDELMVYCAPNATWLPVPITGEPVEYTGSDKPDPTVMLGRYPVDENDELEKSSVHPEFFNFRADEINYNEGCCFKGDCWDGRRCVPNGEAVVNDDGEETIYICAKGKWGSGTPTLNWYQEQFGGEVNPDEVSVQYCVDEWSCACPDTEDYEQILTEDDAWTIQECEKFTSPMNAPADLCTRDPWMYVGDHLCEPSHYDEDYEDDTNQISGANWTSRTKYLASALQKYASTTGNNYILHCGPADEVLNFYVMENDFGINVPESLGISEKDYNNFCALLIGDTELYLGTTLNPKIDFDTIPKALYSVPDPFEGDACIDHSGCAEGQGCYIPQPPQFGSCVDLCTAGSCSEEGEVCDEDLYEENVFEGLCVPNVEDVEDVNMVEIDIDDLSFLMYGNAAEDKTGFLNEDYLFFLNSYTLTNCGTILESTLPTAADPDLMFGVCMNNNIAYNDFLKIMIFSDKDILTPEDFNIKLEDVNKDTNPLIKGMHDAVDYHVTNQDGLQNGEVDIGAGIIMNTGQVTNMKILNSSRDLNNLYYAKVGTKSVFGFLERKAVPPPQGVSGPTGNLKYYYYIHYNNIFDATLNCGVVNGATEELYCDDITSLNEAVIISPPRDKYDSDEEDPALDNSITKYWLDLTAKLRFS